VLAPPSLIRIFQFAGMMIEHHIGKLIVTIMVFQLGVDVIAALIRATPPLNLRRRSGACSAGASLTLSIPL
jgi:hypothetical protein